MDEDELKKTNPFFDGYGMTVTASLKPGVIGEVKGIDRLSKMQEVIHLFQLHDVGERILPSTQGTLASVFTYILCAVKTKDELKRMIATIKDNLSILDVDGKNMLNEILDDSKLKI